MIRPNEIYYLNGALDGKEIYGIDPMETLAINLNSTKTAKESLIEKDILNKDGKINDASYALIEGLEQYKNAKEYLWINEKIVAIDDSNYLIHLERDENEDIVLKKVTKSIMLYSIIKENSLLWGSNYIEKNVEYIPLREFASKNISEKADKDVLYIKKETKGSINLFNIYYKEDDNVFKYDVLSQLLKKVDPRDIRSELINLFNVDWGEDVG